MTITSVSLRVMTEESWKKEALFWKSEPAHLLWRGVLYPALERRFLL